MAIQITRGVAYWLMTGALAAAVFLKGGVYAHQWEWSALAVSLAATLAVAGVPRREQSPGMGWGLPLMALLLAWMALQLVPLPPALAARLAPQHWRAVEAARTATGGNPAAWVAFSLAPAATWERLLDVTAAMAAFVSAREMAWWWRKRMWIVVAPVLAVAWLESLLGLTQFYLMRMSAGPTGSANGTYVDRDHFSGLLEMAFPVALMLAIAVWRKGSTCLHQNSHTRPRQPLQQAAGPAVLTAIALGMAACLLTGVVVSLSRMGFISTLTAAAVTTLMLLSSPGSPEPGRLSRLRWVIPVAVPLLIAAVLPTRELIQRFAGITASEQISKNERIEIWQDTLRLIAADKWTGSGLGAYERGMYPYKTVAPTHTLDFAHNDYLQILAELGVGGGLLVGALALWIVSRPLSVVLWRRGAPNWELAVGLVAALLTLAVHSLADFNLYIPANALALAWLAGAAASPGLKTG